MARKQLIKGANAARVEERIARVPDESESGAGGSIFGALKAMESEAPRQPPRQAPRPLPRKAAGIVRAEKAAVAEDRSMQRQAAGIVRAETARAEKAVVARPAKPSREPIAENPAELPTRAKLKPADFTAAERREILLCCVEYRNRLPTYLVSARKEVEILDSIIEKCGG
jgi:hypothetical protein